MTSEVKPSKQTLRLPLTRIEAVFPSPTHGQILFQVHFQSYNKIPPNFSHMFEKILINSANNNPSQRKFR